MAEGRAEGIAEGKAEGKAEGIAEGKAEGEKNGIDKARRENIKAIMEKLQYTAPQAMDLLDIPAGERSKYMSV